LGSNQVQIKDILYGFGPLEDLLRMPTVSEIMVNASDEIFVEKNGVLQNSGRQFVSDEVTTTVIERIVGFVGRRIDTAQPMVDARLPDGSRVNAVIPPLAVKGPCLTVRKFSRERFSMKTLLAKGSISPQVAEFLEACVRSKRSILVSGGTGTGKTTLLNCLSQAIPIRERIICIEDTHELQLDHPHIVFVECRDGNNEGKGKVVIRDLLKNSLRQRPDRLIIGECRSDEALDMLQAMNTGHDGSMTTIHANNPADALRRLEVLVRESGLPADAVRQQIVSAIDIVVQLTRLPGGKRCVTEVTEVIDFDPVNQAIRLRTLFAPVFSSAESDVQLRPTGCIPSFVCDLVQEGNIQLDLFLRGVADASVC
jgi:pilus assembly protein CpaF